MEAAVDTKCDEVDGMMRACDLPSPQAMQCRAFHQLRLPGCDKVVCCKPQEEVGGAAA